MSLAITILSPIGTLASGAPRLVGRSFAVASTGSFARDLCDALGCRDAYDMLDEASSVEIEPDTLRALRVDTTLNLLNGEVHDGQSFGLSELANAQAAAVPGTRVMIESGF